MVSYHPIYIKSYIKKYLGSPADIDVERLQVEYEKLKDENLRLKKTVEELKKEVTVMIINNFLILSFSI